VKVPAVSVSGSKSNSFARWHMKLNFWSLIVFEGSGLTKLQERHAARKPHTKSRVKSARGDEMQ
jgi:hypothetical protein